MFGECDLFIEPMFRSAGAAVNLYIRVEQSGTKDNQSGGAVNPGWLMMN